MFTKFFLGLTTTTKKWSLNIKTLKLLLEEEHEVS